MISDRQQWINLGIILGVVAAVLTSFFVLLYGKKGRPLWKRIIVGILESVALLSLIAWSFPYVNAFLDKYNWLLEAMTVRLLLGAVAILLGVGAHVFKKKNKLRYGQMEVLFGMFSAAAIASAMTPGQSLFSHWVALAGAIYVVARGLNNWSEELEQHGNRKGHRTIRQNVLSWIFVEETVEGKKK